MRIGKVENLDLEKICTVLDSTKISEAQKTDFVLANRVEIKQIMKSSINDKDFQHLMNNRTIQKFRPLKNSYTKWGDKIILAKALNIKTSEVAQYMNKISNMIQSSNDLDFLPETTMNILKTYAYRHGTKDELVSFLDYELRSSKNIVETLYKTLKYYSGGVADYFIRPIHRMDNKTLVRLFNTVNNNLKQAQNNGDISDSQNSMAAKWALVQIYNIQNNSKLINAIKTYNTLK